MGYVTMEKKKIIVSFIMEVEDSIEADDVADALDDPAIWSKFVDLLPEDLKDSSIDTTMIDVCEEGDEDDDEDDDE
jgi:hypothetical protein